MVTQDIRSKDNGEEHNTKSSEWGPDAAIDMCNRVRHLPCVYGGTLGDVIDSTPKDLISKVMLEDKVKRAFLTKGGRYSNVPASNDQICFGYE